jgi:hypothetical protein
MRCWTLAMLIVLGWTASSPAAEPPPASRAASRPGAAAASAPARPREFRFDALRIDGALRGPEALVVSAALARERAPLHRRWRSFAHRVVELVEAAALHGGH